MIGVAADQHAYVAALVEIDDAAGDTDEVVDGCLEKFVPGIRLEHVHDGLAVMTLRIEAEVLDDALDFAPQYGNVPRASVVGRGGPQAEETMLAGDSPLGVEGLDADVIEVLGAMNAGGGIGLRKDEQLGLARFYAHVAAQHGRAGAFASAFAIAEDAQSGSGVRDELILLSATLQRVVAVAEKHEVPRFHPVQQVARFGDVIRGNRQRAVLQ